MTHKRNALGRIRPRLRILRGDDIALGPGKVELLQLVDQTGSISEAAKRMGMSYMRAWTLVQMMNACFKNPVVVAERGGKTGGGARLTRTGQEALSIYQQMELDCTKVAEELWPRIAGLLRA